MTVKSLRGDLKKNPLKFLVDGLEMARKMNEKALDKVVNLKPVNSNSKVVKWRRYDSV